MNTFGNTFRMTTYGESHGPAVGAVVDGCPANLRIDQERIDASLRRRRDGAVGAQTTARREADTVEWLGGLMEGVTTGAPLAFVLRNEDTRSEDYDSLRGMLRPGHGDYTWLAKHGMYDHRGGGRNSGRITAAWVVAGCVAAQVLRQWHIAIEATLLAPGRVRCVATHVPAGWGAPSFGSCKAMLAQAMMSIPSAMAFEMGAGVEAAAMAGEEYADAWDAAQPFATLTNHCGGVQGGITNGMPLQFGVSFHLPVTHTGTLRCANAKTGIVENVCVTGRHDKDHTSRLLPVVEAMAALALVNFAIEH